MSIEFYSSNEKFVISTIYFPGSNNPNVLADFKNDIRTLSSLHDNHLITGDFNCRHSFWGCQRSNAAGRILYDEMCNNQFLIFHPNEPTHYPDNGRTPSVLDFFLIKGSFHPDEINVHNTLHSDHLPVICDLSSTLEHYSSLNMTRDYEHADWNLFAALVRRELSYHSILITARSDIDNAIQFLSDAILLAFNQSVPLKQKSFNSLTISQEVKDLISQRNIIRRRLQRSRNELERSYLRSMRNDLQTRIDHAMSGLRNDRFNQSLHRINDSKSSPNKKLFQICKFFKNGSRRLPFLRQGNQRLVTDDERCEALANHFESVHQYNHSESTTSRLVKRSIETIQGASIDNTQVPTITLDDVRSTTRTLNSFKAPGPDSIFNVCLKKLPIEGFALLTIIFNACLLYSYFPDAWKQANVSSVLKPGKPSNLATSYRPISLLSVLGKLFEKLILPHFQTHIEDCDLLPQFQFGFRKGRSTIHQLLRVTKNIRRQINNRKSVGLLSIDLQAAFDTVWHNALLHKMLAYNFPIYIIKLTKSYLENRFFRVKISNHFSSPRTVSAGVPQGGVLSPILFNIFVSDMPTCHDVDTAQFADDTLLSVSSYRTSAIINKLSRFGSILSRYFKRWHITINSTKSESCFFSKKIAHRHQPQNNIKILNEEIAWKDSVKYLGLHLDKRLTFCKHIDETIIKCERLIRMLYPLINRNSYLSIHNKLLIYKLYFRPIFCYASPVWNSCAEIHFSKLQRLQNKVIKMILNLHWRTRTSYIHELVNIKLIRSHVDDLNNNFWLRCQRSLDEDIIQIYIDNNEF